MTIDLAVISQTAASSTQQVAASTQEQTAIIHQIAQLGENLSTIAGELQDNIKKFQI